MPQAIRSLLQDPALRFGIKFGLAGILAVYLALLIRLPEPTWALFTVFVLMIAQYVGAIAEKALFRIIGTVCGGILGYLLTASLQQNPILFLLLVGFAVAFCTAMFGQSRYPYAFFLAGLTLVVVVSNGISAPDFSWRYALWRIEEVTLGILVAVLMQSLVWPRYARAEFFREARSAFTDLRSCFRSEASSFFGGEKDPTEPDAASFPARITSLRLLLNFGARESQFFRDHLQTYFGITTSLGRIAAGISTLSRPLPTGSYYHAHLRQECEDLHAAIEAALAELSAVSSGADFRPHVEEELARAQERLESRLNAIRDDPAVPEIPINTVTAFGLHLLALEDIREQVLQARALFRSLPEGRSGKSHRQPPPFTSPLPPPFWLKSGFKSGLAVVLSLILDNWLNPPGGPVFILGSWVFTALNAVSPGGNGDRRAFHYFLISCVILLGTCLLLIPARPLLSSYAVMNIIIFSWLFLWGYLSFSTRGVTIPMQLTMLLIVSIVGLNGQKPISFQAIADIFFGLSFALLLAAVIQRLIWPSLPQWELRNGFVELLRYFRQGSDGSTLPLWQRTRITLIPGEAEVRIRHLNPPICPREEPQLLREYLSTLRHVGDHLLPGTAKLTALLPASLRSDSQKTIAAFESEMRSQLLAHEEGMKSASPPREENDRLQTLLTNWTDWMTSTRREMLREKCPSLEIIRFTGLAGRQAEAARGLLLAKQQADGLHLKDYMGDYVL